MKWIYCLTLVIALAGCSSKKGVKSDNSIDDGDSDLSTYTVTYDGNGNTGGTIPSDPNSPYNRDSVVTVLGNMGNLVKTSSTFVSWNTEADGSGTNYSPSATFVIPEADVNLYARWETGNSIIYESNGATTGNVPVDASSPYDAGDTVTVLGNTGNLARGGFAFDGWNTEIDGSGTDYAPAATFSMPSSTRRLYAQWAALSTHTVTYDGNGNDSGSVPVDANTYWERAVVSVPTNTGNLVKAGNTFAGWSIVVDSSHHAVGQTFFMPSADVTLVAQWIPDGSYSVTYNGNGHTGGTVPTEGNSPFISGALVTVVGNSGSMVRNGDTFLGWNTSANGTGTNYNAGSTFNATEHTVLYARWTQNFNVAFNANGGTGTMSSKSIASGTSANLPANTFTRTNYIFAGWATSANGPVTYSDQQSYLMGNSNTTLYAKWTETNSLKLSYNFNNQNVQDSSGNGQNATAHNITYVPDGSGNYAVQTNGSNSYIELPNNMVLNNPNFTIMMRFKASPSQHGSLFGYQNNVVGSGAANQHVPMIVVRSDGRLRGELWKTSNSAMEVISNNAVNDGQWHSVYFSGDGNTIKLFLDGVLLAQASDSVNHLAMIYNQIGVSRAYGRTLMPNVNTTANNWYYFNGLIDDFFFYDTAL